MFAVNQTNESSTQKTSKQTFFWCGGNGDYEATDKTTGEEVVFVAPDLLV